MLWPFSVGVALQLHIHCIVYAVFLYCKFPLCRVYERFKILNHGRKVNFVDTMFQMLEKYSNNLEELIRERTEQLDIERKKTEQLLNRMLPR